LAGFVRNTTSAALIEVEEPATALSGATLEYAEATEIAAIDENIFVVAQRGYGGLCSAGLPPDMAICLDCCREIDDPLDLRHRYAFLNCAACGRR